MVVQAKYHLTCDGCGELFGYSERLKWLREEARKAGWYRQRNSRYFSALEWCPACYWERRVGSGDGKGTEAAGQGDDRRR